MDAVEDECKADRKLWEAPQVPSRVPQCQLVDNDDKLRGDGSDERTQTSGNTEERRFRTGRGIRRNSEIDKSLVQRWTQQQSINFLVGTCYFHGHTVTSVSETTHSSSANVLLSFLRQFFVCQS